MAPEPPDHHIIATDHTHLMEFDKGPAPHQLEDVSGEVPTTSHQSHDGAGEVPTTLRPDISDPQQRTTDTIKENPDKSEKSNRYLYRIEYTDNTGTVIAVRKGETPPTQGSDDGEDSHVFELIKRVKVFAKASKTSREKSKDDTSSGGGGKDDTPSNTEKKEHTDGKNNETAGKDKTETTGKDRDKEDAKLKEFDISPDSNITWSLKILSEHLMNALRAVVEYYPGLQLLSHNVEFDEPYKELIHHMSQLSYYRDNQPEDHPAEYRRVCKEHIDELLTYLKENFGSKLKEEYARHERDPPVCTFPNLWLLFRPGEEVYWNWGISSPNLVSSYIVEEVTGGVLGDDRVTPLAVQTWNVGYSGWMVGRTRASYAYDFQPFDGEKPIRELKMYPVRFHRDDLKAGDGTALPRKEQFEKEGRAYFELCKSKGHYRTLRGRPIADKAGLKPMVQGRVVVDIDQYLEDMDIDRVDIVSLMAAENDGSDDTKHDDTTARTGCRCIHCGKKPRQKLGKDWTKFDNIQPDESGPVEDYDGLFYRLCHIAVWAYLLKDRRWERIHVSDLYDVSFNENLLDELVLPDHIKNTVQALAWNSSQDSLDTLSADFIEGRGNGQVILLHGEPGVGKTATAECVAELVRRPLISLTCGDLGTKVRDVDKKLKKYMSWGEIWKAVVLLDEADVYLESRQRGEVERNALVSVFLRELEQYRGIMFLTSNRIGTFDDAFLSRIHIGLFYDNLTESNREKIWMNNFERIKLEKRDPPVSVHYDAESYVSGGWKKDGKIQTDLINIRWNGREIRNAFQTALALASYNTNRAAKKGEKLKEVVLRAEHIQSVVVMSQQFKEYIDKTKKGSPESRARADLLRAPSVGAQDAESGSNLGTPTRR